MCDHDNLDYCTKCDVVFCVDCPEEWCKPLFNCPISLSYREKNDDIECEHKNRMTK